MGEDKDDFFRLIRFGLWGEKKWIEEPIENWEEIYSIAKQQTLLGVAFLALQQLPKERQPKTSLYYKWLGCVTKIGIQNDHTNNVLNEIINLYEKSEIDYKVIKGQTISIFYKDTRIRQCGDIDIYVGTSYKRSLLALQELKVLLYHESIKDITFNYKGITIENHRLMCLLFNPFRNYRLQKCVSSWNQQNEWNVSIKGMNVKTLPPTANVVYLFVHLFCHIIEGGVGLRQFCDWAIVMDRFRNEIDWEEVQKEVRYLRLNKSWDACYTILIEDLRMKPITKFRCCDSPYKKLLLTDIMKGGNFGSSQGFSQYRKNSRSKCAREVSFFYMIKRSFFISKFSISEAFFFPLHILAHQIYKSVKKIKNRQTSSCKMGT